MNRQRQIQIVVGGIVAMVLITLGIILWKPNVKPFKQKKYFYVRHGTTKTQLDQQLLDQHVILHYRLYRIACGLMNFQNKDVHPGRYSISTSTSNYSLIHRISNGIQDPVKINTYAVRTPEDLINVYYNNLESDKLQLQNYMLDKTRLSSWDIDSMSLLAAFFATDRETLWSNAYQDEIEKQRADYLAFWNQNRQKRASQLGMTRNDVMILSSIVQGEIMHDEEAGTVARVYINRLKKGMKLQADPTVVFAGGDFTVRRVTNEMLRVSSPFNTYMHKGLPPAPIKSVRKTIADSVLYCSGNDYLFFCANPQKSGYHLFSKTYEEHLKIANDYHQSLDNRNIH